MDDDTRLLRLGGGLMAGLLISTGAVLAGGWLLGALHQAKGRNQAAPEPGSVSSESHHVTAPGR